MKVVMLVISDVDADARVQREAATLAGAGYEVMIVALAGSSTACYTVLAVAGSSFLPGGGATQRGRLRFARRGARWLLLPQHEAAIRRSYLAAARRVTENIQVDIVHAHDFETLSLGHDLASRLGARLVYDSHELWSERIRRSRPTPISRRRDRRNERSLGLRADAVLTVGEEIAEWLRRHFGWNHVTVVRNSFPALSSSAELTPPTALLYAGRIAVGRDLDTVTSAAEDLPLPTILMGPGDPILAERLGRAANVEVRPPVDVNDVTAVYRECGIALVTATDGPLSYRLSMPNKLFQAVQAGVPVIATDLPAQARVVRDYGLGEVYRVGDATSLANAVQRLLKDYPQACRRVVAAQPALSWDTDAKTLLSTYERVMSAS